MPELPALPAPKPHLFPDKAPSNSCYARGCRCAACRTKHTEAEHERLQAKIAGTWTDRRKRVDPLLLEAIDRSNLTREQLLQLLMNNGAAPALIRLPAENVEEVSRETLPGPVTQPPTLVAVSEADGPPLPPVERMRRLMREVASPSGGLPRWIASAPEIRKRLGLASDQEAQEVIRKVWQEIQLVAGHYYLISIQGLGRAA